MPLATHAHPRTAAPQGKPTLAWQPADRRTSLGTPAASHRWPAASQISSTNRRACRRTPEPASARRPVGSSANAAGSGGCGGGASRPSRGAVTCGRSRAWSAYEPQKHARLNQPGPQKAGRDRGMRTGSIRRKGCSRTPWPGTPGSASTRCAAPCGTPVRRSP